MIDIVDEHEKSMWVPRVFDLLNLNSSGFDAATLTVTAIVLTHISAVRGPSAPSGRIGLRFA
jgi:hypothetical protein